MKKLRHLDLFSGIGGFSLGLEATGGFKTIGFSEIEPYPCAVLKKHWPKVKNYGDVRTISKIGCDIITGGFPCQPFSVAGKQRGAEDDRHLWPSMCNVIALCRPTWCICENVPGIIPMELDNCCADLENIGYAAQPIIVPACAVDARHGRARVWIIAHANKNRRSEQFQQCEKSSEAFIKKIRTVNANSESAGRQGSNATGRSRADGQLGEFRQAVSDNDSIGSVASRQKEIKTGTAKTFGGGIDGDSTCELPHGSGKSRQRSGQFTNPSRWTVEPAVGRMADGIPNRVDRLKNLGNSIVPQIAQIFGEIILQIENET